ncbi:hypothetical protein, partial [Pseudomonas sp. Leaf127]|uniref:hypothetical protein n=1 Tax=Pseudomonas sp. Leaf127 TaxID=1736267 RepID=UPI001F2491E4
HRKHPHELLDSIVKERLVELFASTEARILQRLCNMSSDYFRKFSDFLFQLQPLALQISRQREANNTVFKTSVNPHPKLSSEAGCSLYRMRSRSLYRLLVTL